MTTELLRIVDLFIKLEQFYLDNPAEDFRVRFKINQSQCERLGLTEADLNLDKIGIKLLQNLNKQLKCKVEEKKKTSLMLSSDDVLGLLETTTASLQYKNIIKALILSWQGCAYSKITPKDIEDFPGNFLPHLKKYLIETQTESVLERAVVITNFQLSWSTEGSDDGFERMLELGFNLMSKKDLWFVYDSDSLRHDLIYNFSEQSFEERGLYQECVDHFKMGTPIARLSADSVGSELFRFFEREKKRSQSLDPDGLSREVSREDMSEEKKGCKRHHHKF